MKNFTREAIYLHTKIFLVCTRILQSPNAYGIYVIAMSIEADNKLNNMNERKTRLENSHLSMTMTKRYRDLTKLGSCTPPPPSFSLTINYNNNCCWTIISSLVRKSLRLFNTLLQINKSCQSSRLSAMCEWPMNMQIEGWPLNQDFFSFENESPKYNYWGSFIYLKPNLTLAVILTVNTLLHLYVGTYKPQNASKLRTIQEQLQLQK